MHKPTVGAVIYTHELSPFWVRQAQKANLDVLGLHPTGGEGSARSLEEAERLVQNHDFRAMVDELHQSGIKIEYEMHALSRLVPRSLFSRNPDMFRMNRQGERVADFNICPSSREALELTANSAAELADIFKSDTHKYCFWIDDVENAECHCPKCSGLSPSDQALIIYNSIADGIRKRDPEGKQCYLAYRATMKPPRLVKPRDNVFLEFAPICRSLSQPLSNLDESETRFLPELIAIFGKNDAKALDYWLDNSLLSKWKEPPRRFALTPDIIKWDVNYYLSHGIENITTFACYLGDNYVKQHGETPDISGYTAACREVLSNPDKIVF